MADVKVLAEELVNLTVKDVQELAKILKEGARRRRCGRRRSRRRRC